MLVIQLWYTNYHNIGQSYFPDSTGFTKPFSRTQASVIYLYWLHWAWVSPTTGWFSPNLRYKGIKARSIRALSHSWCKIKRIWDSNTYGSWNGGSRSRQEQTVRGGNQEREMNQDCWDCRGLCSFWALCTCDDAGDLILQLTLDRLQLFASASSSIWLQISA